jgi:hypothetical protein
MKFAPLAVAAAFVSTAVFAGEETLQRTADIATTSGPVVMTEAQLDQVSAGAPLLVVDVSNVANNLDVNIVRNVDVNANVAAAVNVLGGATGAGAVQRVTP